METTTMEAAAVEPTTGFGRGRDHRQRADKGDRGYNNLLHLNLSERYACVPQQHANADVRRTVQWPGRSTEFVIRVSGPTDPPPIPCMPQVQGVA
jgi:hypothetical protein